MLDEMAANWTAGNYDAVAARFATDVFYGDAVHYKIRGREDLLRFFEDDDEEPQFCVFHNAIFDEGRQIGVAEYTYEGTKLYHGTVWVEVSNDLISRWREYQYVAASGFDEFWR